MADFLIARIPDTECSLPYLLRIPLGDGIVLRARETWPRTSKVFCFRGGDDWPPDAEIIEALPVRSCVRRGASIDLVLERSRENRSQFVIARARGREMVFWQSPRTTKTAKPAVDLPTARASGLGDLEIVVDSRERYGWKFSHQQASVVKRALRVGDYGVELDSELVAVVERKGVDDLVRSLSSGQLRAVLSELVTVPHAAVVVEDRYSQIFKLTHVRPALVAEMLAECQVHFPSVPVIFAETRALAQEWTYRFLGAALADARHSGGASLRWAADPSVLGDGLASDQLRVAPGESE